MTSQDSNMQTTESPQSEDDEDFGLIRPSLIKQLQSILDQYPDDGQILKELIQNAEDAKATKICFLYDETQHGTDPDKLAHPDLGLHQGPALYAFNDAVFDEKDWRGIRMLQDSVKNKDPMKVGRFGLGFKSVFHITDMPSVLSSNSLAFIDPCERYFQVGGERTTGHRYKLSSARSNFQSRLAHQFEPYQQIFDCDENTFLHGHYNSTLFRFPLRQEASPLSETLYTSEKISELFASFQRDAHLVLLFLKHIESVELCIRRNGVPMETLFKVQVQDSCKENVRGSRKEFLSKLSTSWLNEPVEVVYPLHIETLEYEKGNVARKKVYSWLISEYFAGGDAASEELKAICCDQNCKNVPLVAVALPLEGYRCVPGKRKAVDGTEDPSLTDSSYQIVKKRHTETGLQVQTNNQHPEPRGQVFCCLPLPVQAKSSTGLPVHVNGYFSISQDRQHLKWPNQGQEADSDTEVFWNQCLLKELVPRAYANLILKTVQLCKEGGLTPKHVMDAMPDIEEVEIRERWQVLLKPFYTQILQHKVFYSLAEGGLWMNLLESVFDCLKESADTCTAVRNMLLSNGIKVVKPPPHVMRAVNVYRTQQLKTISPELTRDSIVAAISKSGEMIEEMIKISPEEKRALCGFLGKAECQNLHLNQIKSLSYLPLFETIPFGKDLTTKFVAVRDVKRAAPESRPVKKINTPLLNLSDQASFGNLAKQLNVKVLSQGEFFTDVVFRELSSKLEPETLEETLNFVVVHLEKLQEEKSDFVKQLQQLPFLPSVNGNNLRVTELFDPEVKLLKNLFYAEEKFPVGKFLEGNFLTFLRKIGLKQVAKIQAADILNSALKIESLKHSDGEQLHNLQKKSSAIVKHLSENTHLLKESVQGKMLKEWLTEISWLARLQDRPDIFPSDLDLYEGERFLKPGNSLPFEAAPLAGCVAPICQSQSAGSVLKALGLSLQPRITQILLQMKKITAAYTPNAKAKYLQLAMSIYAHLAKEDVLEIKEAIKDISLQDWVWTGDGFTTTNKIISCQADLGLKPYMFPLPEELEIWKDMFEELGVRNKFCAETMVAVLQDIKRLHSSSELGTQEKTRDLRLAVNILDLLKDQMNDVEDAVRQMIVIPVQRESEANLCLLPIDECTYCDIEWLQQGAQSFMCEESEDIVCIHPSISINTAEALNVPTLMSRMLQGEELLVTGFGQCETLTNRIRSLLEDYTDGYSIVKELLQNADDAGATVLKFLYDERTNIGHETYLLDEGMRECQGPAFWAYNDAMFSQQDFTNITNLGGATKQRQVDKIGKFGLGFNAVYNVTDVPSFVSGNHLVIFDPQATHLGRSMRDRTKPGIKLDLLKNKTLIRKLPDQFYPYQNVFGCEIDPSNPKEYKGTLFRLPLRTARQASRSELSKQTYDKNEMEKLLSLFVSGSQSLLLFTQHVSQIELHHMGPTDTTPEMLFSLSKETIQTTRPLLTDSPVNFDILKVCKNHFENSRSISSSVNDELQTSVILEVKTDVTESGQSFFGDDASNSRNYWMLAFVFSMKHDRQHLIAHFDSGYCLYGAVAVPLRKDRSDFVPIPLAKHGMNGSLYCHLPLPIPTNLPVHINGSFAIQSNRRHLCELTGDDKNSWKAEWNNLLLERAICPAYHLLLQDLLGVNQSTKADYVQLWPALSSVHVSLAPLVRTFYCDKLKGFVIEFDGEQQITVSKAAIFDKDLASNTKHSALAADVFCQSGVKLLVIKIPDEILETILSLNHAAIESQMFGEKRFLREIFFPKIVNLGGELQKEVLVWAFELKDDDIMSTIRESSCIPTSPDGNTLKKPLELIHPFSEAEGLYQNSDGRFIHHSELKRIEFHGLLRQLKMKFDYLDWDSLNERAHSVEVLFKDNPVAATERAELLLQYMDMKLQSEDCECKAVADQFQDIKLLPLYVPPSDTPLTWVNTDLSERPLLSASEAYLSTQANLLSSTCPLVDEDRIPGNVKKFLGLDKKAATVDQVITQLKQVIHRSHRESILKLQPVCFEIYRFLNDKCSKADASNADQKIRDCFEKSACILIDDKFMRPCDLAFDDRQNEVPPYLASVPYVYTHSELRPLLIVLGVREQFEPTDYVAHLQSLKESYGESPLGGLELKKCMQLLRALQDTMARARLPVQEINKSFGHIFVPNVAGILKPSSELRFNNIPWMKVCKVATMVHDDLPYHRCERLGVKTQRWEILSNHAAGIPFGQTARLTTSLKRIVDYYPLDIEILKELVQNADDAAATEIHFVLDDRQHGTERIFDDSWKPLQGPALCVYNNKPFTDKDLEGIQRLGEGTKRDDPCKTGKYGIGFSSVYHLTDAPSILTSNDAHEKMLCVFDPHCCYVPGATEMHPGMKYTYLEELQESFPDVFTGYLQKQFDQPSSTMFRFPLRTEEMAEKSQISKRVISSHLPKEMLQQLKKTALEMLLFLNNLEDIKISSVDRVSGELVDNYVASARLSEHDKAKHHEFHKKCLIVGAKLKSKEIAIEDVQQERVDYTVHLSDNCGQKEDWHVTQILGFPRKESVSDDVRKAYQHGTLALLPRGGVACLLQKFVEQKPSETDATDSGKVFCSLPMPIQSGLPVHIDGSFAMSYENRRFIWLKSGADSSVKLEWNHLLCKEVIAIAYVDVLSGVRGHTLGPVPLQDWLSRESIDRALLTFERNFPKFSKETEEWSSLVKAVYSVMVSAKASLFPCVRERGTRSQENAENLGCSWSIQWLSLCGEGNQKAYFCNRGDPLNSKNSRLKDILHRCHFNIVEVESTLMETLEKSEIVVDHVSRKSVLLFFQSYSKEQPMCHVGEPLPKPIENTNFRDEDSLIEILTYCYSVGSVQTLEGTPLLLTNDNILRVFDARNPVYMTQYCKLFHSCGDWFLHDRLRVWVFGNENLEQCAIPLTSFTVQGLGKCLTKELPEMCSVGEVFPLQKSDSPVNPTLIRGIWDCISTCTKLGGCENSNLIRDICDLQKKLQSKKRPPTGKKKYKNYNHYEDYGYQKRQELDQKRQELDQKRQELDQKRQALKSKIEPLRNWCLLPFQKANGPFLCKLGLAEEVVDTRYVSHPFQCLQRVVQQLPIPQLDCDAFNFLKADFARLLTTTFDQPVQILAAVSKAYTGNEKMPKIHPQRPEETGTKIQDRTPQKLVSHDMSQFLLSHDMSQFLLYFEKKVTDLRTSDKAVMQLRTLPFYKTICGHYIPLTNCDVYVLPEDILILEMDVWQKKSGTVFLQKRDDLQNLFQFIGCANKCVVELYCDFILQHFEYLSRNAQMLHLKHVFDKYLTDETRENDTLTPWEKQNFLSKLKQLSIIADKDGEYHPASHFYDPKVALFRAMVEDNRFPPTAEGLSQWDWLAILKKLGLICHATPEMCVEFATRIALEAQTQISRNVLHKSRTLAEHLLKPSLPQGDEILKKVRSICFIAPESVPQELSMLYPQYGDIGDGKLKYISFMGSYSKKYTELVWTCAGILPSWADPHSKENGSDLACQLGVDETPSMDLVMCNFRRICSHCHMRATVDRQTLKKLCKTCYRFMQQHGLNDGKLNDTLENLTDIPCIIVDGEEVFAKPGQTTMDISEQNEIRPYLFKIPYEYGDYKPLFMALGSSESPSFGQYVGVLDLIHKVTGKEELIPGELLLVYKAMKGLFSFLDKETANEAVTKLFSLSLLGKDRCLYESTKLVFNDMPWLFERVKACKVTFLVDLTECGIKEDPEELLRQLPARCRPEMLSSYVTEELVDENKEQPVSKGIAEKLQSRVCKEAFRSAIFRLAYHQANKTGQKLSKDTIEHALANLSTINISPLQEIRTYLRYKGKRVPESDAEKSCFVKKITNPDCTHKYNVYVENESDMGKDILIPFVEGLNSVLNGILKDSAIFLLPILRCDDADINLCLDQLDVLPDSSRGDARPRTLPVPGTLVPDKQLCLLCNAQKPFKVGEFVAVNIGDKKYVYGIVLEILLADMFRIKIGKDDSRDLSVQELQTFARTHKVTP